ncbi:uncharacterized protein YecT (DUF1311 family) [Rhodoligotrophos appendicifer]|uniref:lysozyme inhibitor LprI family protein n=1 Tax=Rhodoligotrophos appendicifer TaxID=987056 RepID=UPI00118702C8|nr:lysozyme inhibitor LprI family protein [Rhodoligotrophos appendicifer]
MTPRPVRLALIAVLPLLAAPASAQWSPPSLCDARSDKFAAETCLQEALAKARQALQLSYAKARSVIATDAETSPDQKAKWEQDLTASQRAWEAYRDADCGDLILDEWHSGSGATYAQMSCVVSKTQSRAAELSSRYASQ